jgi:hypothetical protein
MSRIIDPSLARGLRRGTTREFFQDAEQISKRLAATRAPSKTGAWFRDQVKAWGTDRFGVTFTSRITGTSKRSTYEDLIASAPVGDPGNWAISFTQIVARTREVRSHRVRLEIALHAIERQMQWGHRTTAVAAVRDMAPALLYAIYLIALHRFHAEGISGLPPLPEALGENAQWPLAIEGGAVVVCRNTRQDQDPDARVAVTVLRDRDRWGSQLVVEAKQAPPPGWDFWSFWEGCQT